MSYLSPRPSSRQTRGRRSPSQATVGAVAAPVYLGQASWRTLDASSHRVPSVGRCRAVPRCRDPAWCPMLPGLPSTRGPSGHATPSESPLSRPRRSHPASVTTFQGLVHEST
jgi:hypothetical protein